MAGFDRSFLDRSVIAVPLARQLDARPAEPHPVLIDLHLDHNGGAAGAAEQVRDAVRAAVRSAGTHDDQGIVTGPGAPSDRYVAATLEPAVILALARADRAAARQTPGGAAIFRIWPDFPVGPLICDSAATVKADAAQRAFAATGAGIVWAVVDSGIDARHPHFARHRNLDLRPPVAHTDLTGGGSPLTDEAGHGTHVAGIIAGELHAEPDRPLRIAHRVREPDGTVSYRALEEPAMAGMAPQCRLVSYKVLDPQGNGRSSTVIAALQEIDRINGGGRDVKVHGVNLSVGYPFDPEWFACGSSPLCVEVDRLVRTGVVVVVAAGNTGYVWDQDYFKGAVTAGATMTINDPGNADRAITVGSTHRDSPHTYGVSYFSSKGPTGDGRPKPDLVAPGERILSCATGALLTSVGPPPTPDSATATTPPATTTTPATPTAPTTPNSTAPASTPAPVADPTISAVSATTDPTASRTVPVAGTLATVAPTDDVPPPRPATPRTAPAPAVAVVDAAPAWDYVEDSGTSMAAPHVSGAAAAFLSAHREYLGRPDDVKRILTATATDLGRDRSFQGAGLIDVMRAIQSV